MATAQGRFRVWGHYQRREVSWGVSADQWSDDLARATEDSLNDRRVQERRRRCTQSQTCERNDWHAGLQIRRAYRT